MHCFRWIAVGSLSSLVGGIAAADPCPNPYEKLIPYSAPLSGDEAQVNIHNMVTLRYDCKTFLSQSVGGISTTFFGAGSDLINAKVAVESTRTGARLNTSVTVLGYEVDRADSDLTTLFSKTFKPEQDLDISQETTVQVGPLQVPIRYGIEGTGSVRVTASARNLGTDLTVLPTAKARAYLQAGVDVQLIKGTANGELVLVDGALDNNVKVQFSPDSRAPSIKIAAVGSADLKALLGSVTARLEVTEGDQKKTYDRELFRWPGYVNTAQIYEHSEKIADMPL